MALSIATHVASSNDLTARWCAAAGTGEFLLSGAGVWPLLAILASAADGPARDELQAAVGAGHGTAEAVDLLRILSEGAATNAALGIWVRAGLPLHQEWVATLPAGVIEELAGQSKLDEWASEHTLGMIEHFPMQVSPEDLLVLATALAAKTRWRDEFGGYEDLYRSSADLDQVTVLQPNFSPVTRVIVEGEDDLDVHLLQGDDALRVGIRALADSGDAEPGSALPVSFTAPGLTVNTETSIRNIDYIELQLPSFVMHDQHNLTASAELFGLSSALDDSYGHFPAISTKPLAVSRAAQQGYAEFSANGFEAAVVTALTMKAATGAPSRDPETWQIRVIDVNFEPPFGFLAVHRSSGLVIVRARSRQRPLVSPLRALKNACKQGVEHCEAHPSRWPPSPMITTSRRGLQGLWSGPDRTCLR